MKIVIGLVAMAGCQASSMTARDQHITDEAIQAVRNLHAGMSSEVDKSASLSSAAIDLNGDGVSEIIAYVKGEDVCGSGGCNLFILKAKNLGYEPVSKTTISWPPVRILESKSNGWYDITVWVQGGGISPGYEARLRFDGKGYPSNPSIVPREENGPPTGTVVIDRSSSAIPLYK